MQVAVEESELEYLLEEYVGDQVGDCLCVYARLFELPDLVHLNAVDALHRKDMPGSALPKDPGHLDPVVALEVLPELPGVARLEGKVHLPLYDPRELVDHAQRVVKPGLRDVLQGQPGKIPQDGDIGLYDRLYAWPLNLDNDFVAVARYCPVHLRDRSRRYGRFFNR